MSYAARNPPSFARYRADSRIGCSSSALVRLCRRCGAPSRSCSMHFGPASCCRDRANRENRSVQVDTQLLKNAAHLFRQTHHVPGFASRDIFGFHHQSDYEFFPTSSISSDTNTQKIKTPTCQCAWILVRTLTRLSPIIKWTVRSGIFGCVKYSA